MNEGTHPEELPAEVLDDVATVIGAEVTLLSRLSGGVKWGCHARPVGRKGKRSTQSSARAHPAHLDETLRAQRVVEHMRERGYPTPAWLGVGATATHVWHLMDFVDAAPVPELTVSVIEQLMEIIELQAGQASEPYDHWSYAWRVATGQDPAVAARDLNETPGEVVRIATSPRKVRFRPTRSDGERAGAAMLSVLEGTGDREEALARFADHLTAHDVEMLERALRPKHPTGHKQAG